MRLICPVCQEDSIDAGAPTEAILAWRAHHGLQHDAEDNAMLRSLIEENEAEEQPVPWGAILGALAGVAAWMVCISYALRWLQGMVPAVMP